MSGRKLEILVLCALAFVGLGMAPLLWAIGSIFHWVALPWSGEYLTTLYCIFMVLSFVAFYPATTMVEGIKIAKYTSAISRLDELEKEYK